MGASHDANANAINDANATHDASATHDPVDDAPAAANASTASPVDSPFSRG